MPFLFYMCYNMYTMYDLLLKQIESVVDKDIPLVSNLANISALLFTMENVNWAGFYLLDKDKLVLGPFQGEVACTIIPLGKGVCGTSAERRETIVVDNVHEFKGHIACSTKSKSEIVVPIIKDNHLIGVIDIDSPIYNRFDNEDKLLLEEIAFILSPLF